MSILGRGESRVGVQIERIFFFPLFSSPSSKEKYMSRLIIKNLPSYVDSARLREHFEQKKGPGGTITDVKVALKADGTSRRFGFLGYVSEKQAKAARDWFDKTFLGSSRISVDVVDGFKDAPTPRPNKRPRLEEQPSEAPAKSKSKYGAVVEGSQSDKSKTKRDDQLDEYMQVMKPRTKKGPSWANDDGSPDIGSSTRVGKQTKPRLPEDENTITSPENTDGISDLEWMKRRMSKAVDLETGKAYEQSDDEDEDEERNADHKPEQPSTTVEPDLPPPDPNRDIILKTSRLFLRNLVYTCTESDLLELFQRFGEISQVHIPLDPVSKASKGMAYVTFAEATSAVGAYETLDKTSFQGRLLHILAAVDRKGKAEVEEPGRHTLKENRESKRKANSGREFNWSMLYMNSDAVVSSVADRMNVAKAEVLNPESDNAAVKLALAETHVIQETKTYLESQGVVLSSFAARARSNTIILVKNIPYGTSSDQIRELFEPHGRLARVLVPPAGTMAVVEFFYADEARRAFGAMAYRRLGNSILYLEKGPLGMFRKGDDVSADAGAVEVEDEEGKPVTIQEGEGEDVGSVPGTTLFIKNLAFSTTTERLTQIFRHLPGFLFARVQTKPGPKVPGGGGDAPRLSMGYGFVGFKSVDGAQQGMKSMQGHVLDGHALHVKFARRGAEDEGKGKVIVGKGRTTKMIVKNVPFEATKKDIRELFSAHGQLKSVRIPKKFDSRSRGFAFLDFTSRSEAENAFKALGHTHLLGRHLVLEWAEEGGEVDVDELRRKAGVGYGGGGEVPGRKRKLDLEDGGEEVG